MIRVRTAALVAVLAATAALAGCAQGESSGPRTDGEIRLDYAYYNPLSLVIRDQRLLEAKGHKVTWIFSAGSNKANESLRAGAVDVGSTAGSAALLARANGTPIKTVEIYSKPEWTALVVRKDSPITAVAQLRGTRIAATKGTDPYFFLLQTLATAGLTASDVQIVNLQHADGKTALERGDVDAWAGLDPYLAQTHQQQGSRLAYRNVDFNTFGFLNARESFISGHPRDLQDVIDAYEQARAWARTHPRELAQLLAREAKVSESVASEELDRTALDVDPVPGQAQLTVLRRIVGIIVGDGDVRSADAAQQALSSLLDPEFAQRRAVS
jgi:sulfonate transport system substrate-binding protein